MAQLNGFEDLRRLSDQVQKERASNGGKPLANSDAERKMSIYADKVMRQNRLGVHSPAPQDPPGVNRPTLQGSVSKKKDPYELLPWEEATRMRANDQAREYDMEKGRLRGEEEFSEGSLGRVNETRSRDIADILGRRKSEADGFTQEEQNAYRDKYLGSANQALEGNLRANRVAMANQGIRGGAATAQEAYLRQQANKANVANESEMYLANIAQKRTGLSAYEQALRDTEADELTKQQYNQSQANLEKGGRLATEYGYASLGAAERAGVAQIVSAGEAGEAMRSASGGGKK